MKFRCGPLVLSPTFDEEGVCGWSFLVTASFCRFYFFEFSLLLKDENKLENSKKMSSAPRTGSPTDFRIFQLRAPKRAGEINKSPCEKLWQKTIFQPGFSRDTFLSLSL